MPAVEVLCTNGRRVKVSVTPNTTFLQVLEEACKEQNLGSVNQFSLRHNRKVLDLSTQFRFANLTNNAKLEMRALEESDEVSAVASINPVAPGQAVQGQPTDTQVRVAVQFPSGQRVTVNVNNQETLWSVLNSAVHQQEPLPDELGDNAPSLLYLNTKISGESHLRYTTLRSLGLVNGTALFKYQIVPRASVAPLPQVPVNQPKKVEEINLDSISNVAPPPPATAAEASAISSHLVQHSTSYPAPMESIPHPPVSDSSFQSTIFVPGASVFQDGPVRSIFDDVGQMEEKRPVQQEPRTLGEMLGLDLSSIQSTTPFGGRQQWQGTVNEFANFKFPDPDPNTPVTDCLDEAQSSKTNTQVDRETVIYKLDSIPKPTEGGGEPLEEESDDIYEFTEVDARRLMASYRTERERLDAPLMTTALRASKRNELYSRYTRCVIQFHLPQQIIIQALFHPEEIFKNAFDFLRGEIGDVGQMELYTTPPKKVFKNDCLKKTFLQLDLLPMSKIFVNVELADCLSIDSVKFSSYDQAWSVVTRYMKSSSSSAAAVGKPEERNKKEGTKPKWLKL